jgi:hypothetical protein
MAAAVLVIQPGLALPAVSNLFPPGSGLGQLYLFLEVLSFIPVGFLIVWARRPPVRPIPATLLATALAVVLAAEKLLFAARRGGGRHRYAGGWRVARGIAGLAARARQTQHCLVASHMTGTCQGASCGNGQAFPVQRFVPWAPRGLRCIVCRQLHKCRRSIRRRSS